MKFKSELQSELNPRSRRYSEELKDAVRAAIHANRYSIAAVRDALGVVVNGHFQMDFGRGPIPRWGAG
ncbi:hypothetical protein [Oligoflexus sp.]|uniref:hypothetical protein n=1 Tax=Oligoflexus sp. TaxID=1971216 RepID=UPI002D76F8C5|nr:hypothetical protein [Oligoflexus sp.]